MNYLVLIDKEFFKFRSINYIPRYTYIELDREIAMNCELRSFLNKCKYSEEIFKHIKLI